MGLEITPLYAALLGLWLVVLSLRVINARLAGRVSLGHGDSDALLVAQRAHGNFTEYVPLALLLIVMVEWQGWPAWSIHALGGTLLLARLVHPLGIATQFAIHPARAGGSTLTLLVISAAALACLWGLFA